MPVTSNEVGFAITLQNDPTTLRPNRETIPFELRDSGLLRNQGLPRPFVNELFYRQGQAILTVQSEYQAADTTLQTNIDTVQSNVDTVASDLTQEITDRGNADTTLQNNIDSVISDLDPLTGALAQAILQQIYPVNSLYTTKNATNPATQLGFGTWTQIAEGRTLVGIDTGDADFNTIGEQGGSKTHTHADNFSVDGHTLTTAEMPSHAHRLYGTDTSSASVEPLNGATVAGDTNGGGAYTNSGLGGNQLVEDTGGDTAHSHGLSGSVTSANSMNPYHVVYIWERTA